MSAIQVFNADEIASFRKAGRILSGCLAMLRKEAVAGITTIELDSMAERYILEKGGLPAFKGYSGYPFTICASVNDECVHGMPGDRMLQDGDIVSLDCGVICDGLYTDACVTVGIGNISKEAEHLLHVTQNALADAVAFLKPGVRVGDISALIQESVEKEGLHPVRSLTGHGLGRTLHQIPDIPNLGKKGTGPVFPAWTVVAIEPIVSVSCDDIRTTRDGWTLVTEDGSLAAHFEHTILVTDDGCEVLA